MLSGAGLQANPLGGHSRTEPNTRADILPSDGGSDPGDDWSCEVKQAKIRIGTLGDPHVDPEFDSAIGELARLIGDDEATKYALDTFQTKLELARAAHGVKSDTKECALSQKGGKSKEGKQGQHRKMRYD